MAAISIAMSMQCDIFTTVGKYCLIYLPGVMLSEFYDCPIAQKSWMSIFEDLRLPNFDH